MGNKNSSDPRGVVRRWVDDLVLGVRLAVGGGRNSWARLALTAIGIGLGVAVLLGAAAIPSVMDLHSARRTDRDVPSASQEARPGKDAVLATRVRTEYRGVGVSGVLLEPQGPGATPPPGLTEFPKPGAFAVSPALDALLSSPDGELLRPRFNGPRTLIADAGLTGPKEVFFYVGGSGLDKSGNAVRVYEFGTVPDRSVLAPELLLLILVALTTLLIPVVVFIATSTRLAAAARDRRLAAIRLVGADSVQTRRIAAGESLIGSVFGLLFGGALFLAGRQLVELFELSGVSVFAVDVIPAWWLALPLVVAVPALAVVVSIGALRNTLVDPLGSVRQGRPVRRKVLWRLVPLAFGLGALTTQVRNFANEDAHPSTLDMAAVVLGVTLVLASIPVLLPWLVEKLVGRLNGGQVSWQLAVRRLQLDSGNAARVIGGLAVVLAGGIALQTVLLAAAQEFPASRNTVDRSALRVSAQAGPNGPDEVLNALRAVPGLRSMDGYASGHVRGVKEDSYLSVYTGSCEELAKLARITGCAPGRSWLLPPSRGDENQPKPGEKVRFVAGGDRDWSLDWTLPKNIRPATLNSDQGTGVYSGLLVAPGVLPEAMARRMAASAVVYLEPGRPDTAEHVRNALGPLAWHATVTLANYQTAIDRNPQAANFAAIKRGVLGGVLVALLLAAASLLVIGFEQVRERRRPLAVLAANGVPRRTLALSLVWQNAMPVTLAVVIATGTGIGLSALLLRTLDQSVAFDWAGIGLSSGAALVAALLVSALTLPSVLRAMRPEGLRAE
ncbi:cell division protein FtsX [Crossiella equi]|uniref:Cell division protein FtsX n=1 Tax=Crossiella equi TaxID=130796 RepID=A0ABS5AQW9_9PSEU|nr:ABC transporter permease [Crossiella equi]MBP2478965.1 cell division protein FtsX [Crossiella equi]